MLNDMKSFAGNRNLFRRGLYFDTASKYGSRRNRVHLADPISTISNRMFLYRLMLMEVFAVIIPGNIKVYIACYTRVR